MRDSSIMWQCCRSVTFLYGSGCGSGSSYLHFWLTDPDADPGGPKTYGSCGSGSGTLAHLHHLSKIKKFIKKSQNSRNQCFSYYFCLMMEGSEAGSGTGSVLVNNGSGCGSGSATRCSVCTCLSRYRLRRRWYSWTLYAAWRTRPSPPAGQRRRRGAAGGSSPPPGPGRRRRPG